VSLRVTSCPLARIGFIIHITVIFVNNQIWELDIQRPREASSTVLDAQYIVNRKNVPLYSTATLTLIARANFTIIIPVEKLET